MSPEILLKLAKRCGYEDAFISVGRCVLFDAPHKRWYEKFKPETNAAQALEVLLDLKLEVNFEPVEDDEYNHWEASTYWTNKNGVHVFGRAKTPQQAICNCAEKVMESEDD